MTLGAARCKRAARSTQLSDIPHRNFNSFLNGRFDRQLVPGVRMTRDAESGIVRQHTLEPNAHLGSAIGDDYLPRMERVANPDPAAVVERDPGGAARDVEHCVQDWPVGDGVASVAHGL